MKPNKIKSICDEVVGQKLEDVDNLKNVNEVVSYLLRLRNYIDKTLKIINWHYN